jgi:hypothetical protein
MGTILTGYLSTSNRLDFNTICYPGKFHRPAKIIVVRHSKSWIPKFLGTNKKLFQRGSPLFERIIAVAMKLDILRGHFCISDLNYPLYHSTKTIFITTDIYGRCWYQRPLIRSQKMVMDLSPVMDSR